MLGAFLALLGFLGGGAIAYFLMDAPRRKYLNELQELKSGRRRLQDEIENHRLEGARQRLYERELNQRDDRLDIEERKFAQTRAAFAERAISYGILETENRILRSELKNAAVHTAFLEHLKDSSRMSESVVELQRNTLGKSYFEEVVTNSKRSLTLSNYIQQKKRIQSVAERLRDGGLYLAPTDESRSLTELHDLYLKAIRADSERKEQARLKELMREDEKRQREAQDAIEQAERERLAIEAQIRIRREAIEKVLVDVGGKHAAELEALQILLAEAEAKSIRMKSNAEMGIKHGHVYVISNIGAFGEDVFKIGMTRRTEPLDRVKELGDASVPFPFDVHMLIKCDDAPKLENALHKAFNSERMNRVNPRKEFFRAKFDDILAMVQKQGDQIEFVSDPMAIPEAQQYRDSQTTTVDEMAEIDELYEEAGITAASDEAE